MLASLPGIFIDISGEVLGHCSTELAAFIIFYHGRCWCQCWYTFYIFFTKKLDHHAARGDVHCWAFLTKIQPSKRSTSSSTRKQRQTSMISLPHVMACTQDMANASMLCVSHPPPFLTSNSLLQRGLCTSSWWGLPTSTSRKHLCCLLFPKLQIQSMKR